MAHTDIKSENTWATKMVQWQLTLNSLRVPIGAERHNFVNLINFCEVLPRKFSCEDLLTEVMKL